MGKAKLEISSGGVVYRKERNKIQFLLIKDSYGRWALPKGKIEKNEKPEEAAKREIQEETGLKDLKIVSKLGQIKYFYKLHDQPIFKIVYNYLLETNQKELKPSWEIKEAKWYSQKEALKTIAYKNTKVILEKAIDKLKSDEVKE